MNNILILIDCSASVNIFHKRLYSEIVRDICNDNISENVEIFGFCNEVFPLTLQQYMEIEFYQGTDIKNLYDTIPMNYVECHMLTDGLFEMFPGKFERNYMYIIDECPSISHSTYNWNIEMFEANRNILTTLKNMWGHK